MPYINVKLTCAVSREKERMLKSRLGEAITVIGKTEEWLMVEVEENRHIWFRGENLTDCAYVEVSLLGKSTREKFDELTRTICDIIYDELPIAKENIYVKYEQAEFWGWNGGLF